MLYREKEDFLEATRDLIKKLQERISNNGDWSKEHKQGCNALIQSLNSFVIEIQEL